MNKEQSEKYIDIVKNGNYDDMFDFGVEVEYNRLLTLLEEKVKGMKKPPIKGLTEDEEEIVEAYNSVYNQALSEILSLIEELKK